MRPNLTCFVFVTALATGCTSHVDGGATSTVSLTGYVFSSLCDAQPGAAVEALDDATTRVTSDAQGAFAIAGVPASTALLATAAGHTPTISTVRDYTDGQSGVELALVPEDVTLVFHLLAGFNLPQTNGTIVVAVIDQTPLPVRDAEVTLLGEDGAPAAANANRRQVDGTNTAFAFYADSTTRDTGVVAFFDVPPGSYRLQTTRQDYSFADAAVEVRAGTVTFDFLPGTGSGGSVPSRISGLVHGGPAFPANGSDAPMSGVTMTARSEDGSEVSTTTDANGNYVLDMPFMRRKFDLTANLDPYYPLRTSVLCGAGTAMQSNFSMGDSFYEQRGFARALGPEAAAAGTGNLIAYVYANSTTGLAGATLALDPPVRAPFYGEDWNQPARCAYLPCGPGDSCGAGTRCQNGECVTGDSGPLCDSCDTTSCPNGSNPFSTLRPGSTTDYGCYCMPAASQCDISTPSCGPGTYCWTYTQLNSNTDTWEITGSTCYIYEPLLTSTGLSPGGQFPMPVFFLNLPPGEYTVTGTSGSGSLLPTTARVSAGVETAAALILQ